MLYDYLDQVVALKVRIMTGVTSLLQLLGFIARLCDVSEFHKKKQALISDK